MTVSLDRLMRWWTLIPFLLLAVWCGAHGLDADTVSQDEYRQIDDVRVSSDPVALAAHVAANNPWHVPAYFILLRPWGQFFGWNPVPMRVTALLFGVLAVAMTYRLGAQHLSRQAGWAGAAILTASAFFIYYWHELRMYTLAAFVAALVLWAYLSLVRAKRPPRWLAYVGFYLAVMLALLTHYFLGIFLAGLGLYHLLFTPRGRRWWALLGVFAAAALSFLPWIVPLLKATDRTVDEIEEVLTNPEVIERLGYLFANGAVVFFVGLALLALVPLWAWRGTARRTLIALWFIIATNIGLALLANSLIGLFPAERMRYLIYLWPLLALAVGAGIVHLPALLPKRAAWARAVPLAVLVLWLGIGFYRSATALTDDNILEYEPAFPIQQVYRDVDPLHQPGDFILHVLPDDDWTGHYLRSIPFLPEIIGLAVDARAVAANVAGHESNGDFDEAMSAIGPGRQYVWVAYPASGSLLLPDVVAALTPTYGLCGTVVTHAEFAIDEYAPSPVCCTPDAVTHAPLARYGDTLALSGFEMRPGFDDGTLDWFYAFSGADTLPSDPYSVALHVVDADGALVAQADSDLPTATFRCERHALPVADLPPGDYSVRLIVYNWQTGERLPATMTDTGDTSDAPTVARFTLP